MTVMIAGMTEEVAAEETGETNELMYREGCVKNNPCICYKR